MSEWTIKSIADLATFHRGITWSSSQETYSPEPGCVPVLRIPNVQERLDTTSILFLRGISAEHCKRFAATRNWLLMVGSNGNPDRVGDCVRITQDNDFLFASFLVGVEPKLDQEVDPCFLHYLLRSESVRKAVSDSIKGTTGLRNISLSHLVAYKFPCPPLPQQRKIARILTTLDNLIEKTEALIAKYQSIKQGMMHDLFTRGVDEQGHLRPPQSEAPELYKQSELGWIPKEWEVKQLCAYLSFISYGFTNPMPETKDGPLMVTAANIFGGVIQYETCRHTSQHAFDNLLTPKSRPLVGDILLTKDGSLGRLAIVDQERLCINQSIAVLRPCQKVNATFLMLLLSSPAYQARILDDAGGSTIKHIYITVVDKMLTGAPHSAEEQERIVSSLLALDTDLFLNEAYLSKLRLQKQGLMQDLLTGKVRVTPDEEDERV